MILKRKHALPMCSPHPCGLLWDQTQPYTTNHRFFPKVTIIPLLPRTRLSPCDSPDRAAYYLILGLLFPGFISDRHLAGRNKKWRKGNRVHCCHRWNCTFTFLCLWFHASLIYINNCPTRCNKKQSIYYSASSLYMFRVSTTHIIRSTQNCNYSLRYWSGYSCLPPTWPR